MTEPSRLDQIEAILATTAQQQQQGFAETRALIEANAQGLAATQQRLDQTQAICDANARAIAEAKQAREEGFRETKALIDSNARAMESNSQWYLDTKAICDSNARAIEANSAAIAAGRQETDEVRADLRNAVQMVIDLGTHFTQQMEADRAERLALSADVRSLVETLRERFDGNGHGQH